MKKKILFTLLLFFPLLCHSEKDVDTLIQDFLKKEQERETMMEPLREALELLKEGSFWIEELKEAALDLKGKLSKQNPGEEVLLKALEAVIENQDMEKLDKLVNELMEAILKKEELELKEVTEKLSEPVRKAFLVFSHFPNSQNESHAIEVFKSTMELLFREESEKKKAKAMEEFKHMLKKRKPFHLRSWMQGFIGKSGCNRDLFFQH